MLSQIQQRIAAHYQCVSVPCTPLSLALRQWVNSTITRDLPTDLFDVKDTTDSIASWNPQMSPAVPEYFVFSQKSRWANLALNVSQAERIFSSVAGGILDFGERLYFFQSVLEGNNSVLSGRFGLTANQSWGLLDYWRDLAVNSLFGGLFVSKTPYEFLWGFENNYIQKTVLLPSLF